MPLATEILTAIRFQNFNQAIFLLSLAEQSIFGYKYNLILGILNYKNGEHTRAIFHLRICDKTEISSDQDEDLRRTYLFYSALAFISLKKNTEAINMLETILRESSDKDKMQKFTVKSQNMKNDTSLEGNLDRILARYIVPHDSKYLNSLLASLLIKNEQSALSIIYFKKSLTVFSSFIYLYENMLIPKEDISKYHYKIGHFVTDIQNTNISIKNDSNDKISNFEQIKSHSLRVEEITALHFKALRNDLLDFLKRPFLMNPLINFHKNRLLRSLNNLQNPKTHYESPNVDPSTQSYVYYSSTLFLQSCATVLFHNYNIEQSHFIFNFLYDLNCLDKSYQTLWSTILWLKREKEQLGIVARKAVLTQGNFTDSYSSNMEDEHKGPLVEKKEEVSTDMAYNSSETWIILSNYFSLCSDHNRSIICLKKAISSDNIRNQNIFYYPYLLLAHELMLKHDYEKSLRMFYKTLRMNHNSYSAMYGIGMVILKSSSYSDMCSVISLDQQLAENKSQDKNKTETLSEKTGISECTTAKHFFTRAMKIVPANKAVRYMLIHHMNKIREPKDCLKEILKYFEDDIHGNDKQLNGHKRFFTSNIYEDLGNIVISEPVKKDLSQILTLVQNNNLKDEYTDLILLELVELLCSFRLYKIADNVIKTIKNTAKMYKKRREMVDAGISGDF